MIELKAFGSGEPFRLRGDTKKGTQIFNAELTEYFHIPGSAYRDLLREFSGREFTMGEFQPWLAAKTGFKRDLSPRVAAVLLAEGLACEADGKLSITGKN